MENKWNDEKLDNFTVFMQKVQKLTNEAFSSHMSRTKYFDNLRECINNWVTNKDDLFLLRIIKDSIMLTIDKSLSLVDEDRPANFSEVKFNAEMYFLTNDLIAHIEIIKELLKDYNVFNIAITLDTILHHRADYNIQNFKNLITLWLKIDENAYSLFLSQKISIDDNQRYYISEEDEDIKLYYDENPYRFSMVVLGYVIQRARQILDGYIYRTYYFAHSDEDNKDETTNESDYPNKLN